MVAPNLRKNTLPAGKHTRTLFRSHWSRLVRGTAARTWSMMGALCRAGFAFSMLTMICFSSGVGSFTSGVSPSLTTCSETRNSRTSGWEKNTASVHSIFL